MSCVCARRLHAGGIIGQIHLLVHMQGPSCKHARTQVIAKDEDAQYVECLDCGEILESGEITDGADSTESLSDA